MACPFFYPTERLKEQPWPHPSRLPLGHGFAGRCRSRPAEEFLPGQERLRDCCNLGYARPQCDRFPADSLADAVRFALSADEDGLVTIHYVVEKSHHPFEHGSFRYDAARHAILESSGNPSVRRQAEVYAESYLLSKGHPAA
jgi:hypothetical protein